MSEVKFDPKKFSQFKLKSAETLTNILKGKPKPAAPPKKKTRAHPVLTFLIVVFSALFIAAIIRTFFVQIFVIPSNSMEPTLNAGDRVMVNKITYGIVNPLWGISETKRWFFSIDNPFYDANLQVSKVRYIVRLKRDPRRMDIIVFKYPAKPGEEQKDMVKRIIGLPGETVKIRNGLVYINDKPLREKHTLYPDKSDFGPVRIPYGSYFVLGDNRTFSNDSRSWGVLSGNRIIGIVSTRVWSTDKSGSLK